VTNATRATIVPNDPKGAHALDRLPREPIGRWTPETFSTDYPHPVRVRPPTRVRFG